MRGADDDDYINNDELYPKGTLTPRTLETPPVIIDQDDQLKGEELKYYHENNCCRDYQYCLDK